MKNKYRDSKRILSDFSSAFFENTLYRDTRVVEMISTIKRFINPSDLHKVHFNLPYQEEKIKYFDMVFIDIKVRFKIVDNCISFAIINGNELPKNIYNAFLSIVRYLMQAEHISDDAIDLFKLTKIELEQLSLVKAFFKNLFGETSIEFLNMSVLLSKTLDRDILIRNSGLLKMLIYKARIIGIYSFAITDEDNSETLKILFNTLDKVEFKVEKEKKALKESLVELSKATNKDFDESQFNSLVTITKEALSVNLVTDVEMVYKKFEDTLLDVYGRYTDDLVSSFTIALRQALVVIEDSKKYNIYKKEQERIVE